MAFHMKTQQSHSQTNLWAYKVRHGVHAEVSQHSLTCVALSKRGGIVARGILVDFVRYAEKNNIKYDPLGPYAIKLHQIKDVLADQGTEIRDGDILLVRAGISKYLHTCKPEDKSPPQSQTHVGIDPEPELLEWIWNSHFAAVGGDSLACEAVPAYDGTCKSRSCLMSVLY
jgi:hypothetical protein